MRGPPNYAAAGSSEATGGQDYKSTGLRLWRRYRSLYPGLYTLLALAIFSSPVICCVRLAADPTLSYWLSWTPWLVLIVPGLVMLCHLVQLRRPNLLAVIFSSIVPSAVLVILSAVMRGPIMGLVPQLQSRDCSTFPQKWGLEEAYRTAHDLYQTCVSDMSSSGLSARSIEDCAEYQHVSGDLVQYIARWKYLKHLETEEGCAGFCFAGEPALWSPGAQNPEICAAVVAGALQDKGLRSLGRLFWSAMICLVLSIISVVIFQQLTGDA
mmetsp:Transcript_49628/g.118158  ORF Transcript_49628/g.118158 Transcript_49628/m.118158 type:complete len:268 (-) Transcript_49628:56-859(-)